MVWWRRILTVPHVIRLTRRAPSGATDRWDHFWSGVTQTGDGGDVLWDASGTEEVRHYLDLLTAHADRRRPIVDIGCGNGRFTRALAAHFPAALGVDRSSVAVERARFETAGDAEAASAAITFRTLDVTGPGSGRRVRDELGEDANVFVRGVFHVLDVAGRRAAAANIAALVTDHGVVLIAETNHRGPRLGYLERLGAGPRGIPRALAKALASGIPAPLPFGEAELDACFPPERWRRVVLESDATIMTVPSSTPGTGNRLPGLVAVLSLRHPPARDRHA